MSDTTETVICYDCQDAIPVEDSCDRTGNSLCVSCDDEYSLCNDCGTHFRHSNEGNSDNWRTVCGRCADNYFRCEGCESLYGVDSYWSDGYCVSCRPDDDAYERYVGPDVIGDTFDEIVSQRAFGIELEFSSLDDKCRPADVAQWGACEDGTSGVVQEYYSPILRGDEGLTSVRKLCNALGDYDCDASCGFHLHVDMRDEKPIAIARIAVAYHIFGKLWGLFVPESRRNNTFCRPHYGNPELNNAWSIADNPNDWNSTHTIKPLFDAVVEGKFKYDKHRIGERYFAINWESYHKHQTMEVRLHTGTGNATKVCNWIKAHTRFCDWASGIPLEALLTMRDWNVYQLMSTMRSVWQDDELWNYYHSRAYDFGTTLESVKVRVPQSYHRDYRVESPQRSLFPFFNPFSGKEDHTIA